jgi:protein-S-isoprenylcysteine O-methyltransferase Ste14
MEPYWSDGDALQWIGLIANCACAAAIIWLARQRPTEWVVASR